MTVQKALPAEYRCSWPRFSVISVRVSTISCMCSPPRSGPSRCAQRHRVPDLHRPGPFREEKPERRSAARERALQDARSGTRRTTIIEGLQPYVRSAPDPEGDPLWLLHFLAVVDKHRTPHHKRGDLGANRPLDYEAHGVEFNIDWQGRVGASKRAQRSVASDSRPSGQTRQ